jgi:hypothetical protein
MFLWLKALQTLQLNGVHVHDIAWSSIHSTHNSVLDLRALLAPGMCTSLHNMTNWERIELHPNISRYDVVPVLPYMPNLLELNVMYDRHPENVNMEHDVLNLLKLMD